MKPKLSEKELSHRPKVSWLALYGMWSLFGFCYANETFFEMQARGMHHSYARMIFWGILTGVVWAILTPAVLVLSRNFPLERPNIWKSVGPHLIGFAWTCLVGTAGIVALTMLIRPFDPLSSNASFDIQFVRQLRFVGPYTLFIYGTIVGGGHALEYRWRAHEREIEATRLEALLAQAQIVSLKMQLHPHFLFNTLNGIVGLVRSGENERAVSMLLGLSTMLRHALENSGRQQVTLSEEIEFLRLYLDIERMRFPDRLQTNIAIEPGTEEALVPSLLLQPLVENAVRHGVAQKLSPTTVSVMATRTNGTLNLRVTDDGAGLRPESNLNEPPGIGLANTRERLQHLYGDNQSFVFGGRMGGGVAVSVSIPYSVQASQP